MHLRGTQHLTLAFALWQTGKQSHIGQNACFTFANIADMIILLSIQNISYVIYVPIYIDMYIQDTNILYRYLGTEKRGVPSAEAPDYRRSLHG